MLKLWRRNILGTLHVQAKYTVSLFSRLGKCRLGVQLASESSSHNRPSTLLPQRLKPLAGVGFVSVSLHVEAGLFSAFGARKPILGAHKAQNENVRKCANVLCEEEARRGCDAACSFGAWRTDAAVKPESWCGFIDAVTSDDICCVVRHGCSARCSVATSIIPLNLKLGFAMHMYPIRIGDLIRRLEKLLALLTHTSNLKTPHHLSSDFQRCRTYHLEVILFGPYWPSLYWFILFLIRSWIFWHIPLFHVALYLFHLPLVEFR